MDAVFTAGEPGYPKRLLELSRPPRVIHVRGTIPKLSPSVAIVGARRSSERGRTIAERWAKALARAGVTIVSGGALGVDAAAHRGAILGGRPTLVVLPTSLEHPAPHANRSLFDEVLAQGGAWLTENDGLRIDRHDFCTRNRLMAALVDLVVVIEAGTKSGTRYTVAAAKQLGRPVAAVPWALGDPGGAGCLSALSAGGTAVTSPEDVLKLLGMRVPRRRARKGTNGAAEADVRETDLGERIRERLEEESCTAEELARDLDVDAPALLCALTVLEIEGAVVMRGGRAVLSES